MWHVQNAEPLYPSNRASWVSRSLDGTSARSVVLQPTTTVSGKKLVDPRSSPSSSVVSQPHFPEIEMLPNDKKMLDGL